MHRFGKKNLLIGGIALLIVVVLAIATRSTLQSAGADTGEAIRNRNAKIQEAFRMAEEW
ncbi:MAG: hypothetical protein QGG42_02335 [Phycisphaerae bacterium]|jgi:hypothetical protein|nr:hypothetical protein [Phycisphaerae bacterium]